MALGKTEKLLIYCRQWYHERGNKAHTLLARQLREDGERRTPHTLRNANGDIVYDPNAQIFYDYISKLYSFTDELPVDLLSCKNMIHQFLSFFNLPFLLPEALDSLNSPIDITDIEDVLKALSSGKAPGPDGLTSILRHFPLNCPAWLLFIICFWKVHKFLQLRCTRISPWSLRQINTHWTVQTRTALVQFVYPLSDSTLADISILLLFPCCLYLHLFNPLMLHTLSVYCF